MKIVDIYEKWYNLNNFVWLRLRKQAYVEELKRTFTELVAQWGTIDLEKHHENKRDTEVRKVPYRVMTSQSRQVSGDNNDIGILLETRSIDSLSANTIREATDSME